MRSTFHLVPRDTWLAREAGVLPAEPYVAASLVTEGFVHCTDGLDELGPTFDRHYSSDPAAFFALTIDLDALDVPWRFDAPGSPYPHIYGPIIRSAIVYCSRVDRTRDGRFAGLEPVSEHT